MSTYWKFQEEKEQMKSIKQFKAVHLLILIGGGYRIFSKSHTQKQSSLQWNCFHWNMLYDFKKLCVSLSDSGWWHNSRVQSLFLEPGKQFHPHVHACIHITAKIRRAVISHTLCNNPFTLKRNSIAFSKFLHNLVNVKSHSKCLMWKCLFQGNFPADMWGKYFLLCWW